MRKSIIPVIIVYICSISIPIRILVEPVVAAGWPGSPPGAVCDAAHTAMTRVNSNT